MNEAKFQEEMEKIKEQIAFQKRFVAMMKETSAQAKA